MQEGLKEQAFCSRNLAIVLDGRENENRLRQWKVICKTLVPNRGYYGDYHVQRPSSVLCHRLGLWDDIHVYTLMPGLLAMQVTKPDGEVKVIRIIPALLHRLIADGVLVKKEESNHG